MKKTIMAVLTVAIFVAMLGVAGTAYAMPDAGKGPGNGSGSAGTNSTSILSAYMTEAMASVLGLDPADLTARLDSGETFYTIALSLGYTQDQLADLFASVQALAIELAAADGITVVQAQNGNGNRSRTYIGTCDGTGDCVPTPTYDTSTVASLYTGANGGRRGGRR
jgi:hypothetical protein